MSIIPETKHRKIYTGSKINAQFLQAMLLESEIKSIVRDDGESARLSGYAMEYMNEAKLLVSKEDFLKAKHFIDSSLDEHGNLIAADQEILAEQAMTASIPLSRKQIPNQKSLKRDRGIRVYIMTALLLAFALWRLFPLLQGEEQPWWRIIASSSLIILCLWILIRHLRSK